VLPELRDPLGGVDLRFSSPLTDTCLHYETNIYGASASRGVPVYFPAVKPVPNYAVGWQRHISVNNLPKVTMQRYPAETRTRDHTGHRSDALPNKPPRILNLPVLVGESRVT